MILSSQQKNHYFRKEFLDDTFFSVRTFARIRQHCFSKYWGDGCMDRSPPQILGGPSPRPPRSPPEYGLQFSYRFWLWSQIMILLQHSTLHVIIQRVQIWRVWRPLVLLNEASTI